MAPVVELGRDILEYWPEFVVIESFQLRGVRLKGASSLDPVRVGYGLASVLEILGYDGQVRWQVPGKMSVATNERLRMWDLWVVGSEHERDAMRHAVAFLRDLRV